MFDYEGQSGDELTFNNGDSLRVIRKGDDKEREWWWAEITGSTKQGYVPRNLMGVSLLSTFYLCFFKYLLYCVTQLNGNLLW